MSNPKERGWTANLLPQATKDSDLEKQLLLQQPLSPEQALNIAHKLAERGEFLVKRSTGMEAAREHKVAEPINEVVSATLFRAETAIKTQLADGKDVKLQDIFNQTQREYLLETNGEIYGEYLQRKAWKIIDKHLPGYYQVNKAFVDALKTKSMTNDIDAAWWKQGQLLNDCWEEKGLHCFMGSYRRSAGRGIPAEEIALARANVEVTNVVAEVLGLDKVKLRLASSDLPYAFKQETVAR